MLKFINKILGQNLPYENLNSKEFQEAIKTAKKPVIIDVRSKSEFNNEKIPNSLNIDIFSPNFNQRIANLDPQKEYFMYCQSGMRSKRACKRMIKAGFKKVYNLRGGISQYEGRTV